MTDNVPTPAGADEPEPTCPDDEAIKKLAQGEPHQLPYPSDDSRGWVSGPMGDPPDDDPPDDPVEWWFGPDEAPTTGDDPTRIDTGSGPADEHEDRPIVDVAELAVRLYAGADVDRVVVARLLPLWTRYRDLSIDDFAAVLGRFAEPPDDGAIKKLVQNGPPRWLDTGSGPGYAR